MADKEQGNGGVSMFALKLALALGPKVVLSSSSDDKLEKTKQQFSSPPILTVNYRTNPNWHEEVLKLIDGVGVDLVLENGGTSSIVKSMKCTRRGGIVSQVGHLGEQNPQVLADLVSTIIDRRLMLRGINAGLRNDLEDFCAALTSTQMQLDDIIDTIFPFEKADEALEHLWQGKVVGKLVINLDA